MFKLKTFLIISLLFNIIFITTLGIIFFKTDIFLTSAKLSPPFPLDHPEATYIVKKEDNNYCIHYKYGNASGCMIVGNSKVDLANHLNKAVVIKGSYPKYISEYFQYETKEQCIQRACHALFPNQKNASAFAINIDQISKK